MLFILFSFKGIQRKKGSLSFISGYNKPKYSVFRYLNFVLLTFLLKIWFESIVSCVLYMRFWFLLMCYFKCRLFQGNNLSVCVSLCRYVPFFI
uniref:Putative ovule protein n=1 Tax=Solanum chacoense TaxID=4108 RepID=A0A0V0IRP3_SOLCH